MSKPYTVQCGYLSHYAHIGNVEADSPEEAAEKAIEAAGASDLWKSTDGSATTFVDAMCEGEDADGDLWGDGAIPVPGKYRQDADQLAGALREAIKSLVAERDCQYESVAVPSTGEIDDEEDAGMIREMDAEIDRYRDVLKRCGYGGPTTGEVVRSFPEGITRCFTHRCDNKAEGWLVAPDGSVVPGGESCRECAMRCVNEYREKLGERWSFHRGSVRTDGGTPVRELIR